MSDYEWFHTPYGDFRLELKPHKTWTSYDREGNELVTGLTKISAIMGLPSILRVKQLTGLTQLDPVNLKVS